MILDSGLLFIGPPCMIHRSESGEQSIGSSNQQSLTAPCTSEM